MELLLQWINTAGNKEKLLNNNLINIIYPASQKFFQASFNNSWASTGV